MVNNLWSDSPLVSSRQIRAARALLGWSQQELADRSGISRRSIAASETGEVSGTTLGALEATFDAAGIHFIADDHGRGVYLNSAG